MLRNPWFWSIAVLVLGVVLAGRWVAPRVLQAQAGLRWQETAPGMELGTLTVRTVGNGETAVTAVRFDPVRCAIRAVDARKGVDDAGAQADAVCPPVGVAINASYFAEDLTPLGLLVVDGTRVQGFFPQGAWGAFWVRAGQPELRRSTGTLPAGVTQAIECKPRLVVDGTIPTFKPQGAARRAGVGIDADGRVVFAVTTGYLTLEQWAACFRDEMACANALNLDGGPSAQLAVRGRVDASVPGGWPVPVLLTVAPQDNNNR